MAIKTTLLQDSLRSWGLCSKQPSLFEINYFKRNVSQLIESFSCIETTYEIINATENGFGNTQCISELQKVPISRFFFENSIVKAE